MPSKSIDNISFLLKIHFNKLVFDLYEAVDRQKFIFTAFPVTFSIKNPGNLAVRVVGGDM